MKNKIKKLLRGNKYIEMFAYILQNNQLFNYSGDGTFSKDINSIYTRAKTIADRYVLKYSQKSLENKIILEIGTGYTKSTMLYLIKKYNVKKVYCYDRFDCLYKDDEKLIKKFGLDSYINRVEYICGENKELLKYIEQNSIDYIVSNSVLEHVDNLDVLFDILTKLLKQNASMYHSVDLKCHNRFRKYGELYFHTFNNKIWEMMGDKIGQPNRKLVDDYIQIFKNRDLQYISNIRFFSAEEIEKAKIYLQLNEEEIKRYNASGVEFNLCKK